MEVLAATFICGRSDHSCFLSLLPAPENKGYLLGPVVTLPHGQGSRGHVSTGEVLAALWPFAGSENQGGWH